MNPRVTHRFKVTPKAAARLQEDLRGRLEIGRTLDLKMVSVPAPRLFQYIARSTSMGVWSTVVWRPRKTLSVFSVSRSGHVFQSEYPPMVSVPAPRLFQYMALSTIIFWPEVFEVTMTAARPLIPLSAML